MKQMLTLSTLAVLLAGTAHAQSPEDIARRCAERVNQVVERCTNAAVEETQECVRRIHELIEVGRYAAARQVAHACIRSATARTEKGVNAINRLCNVCVGALLEMGEEVLARRLSEFCDDAIEDLRQLLQRETNAILEALEG